MVEEKSKKTKEKVKEQMESISPWEILAYPLLTEKPLRSVEKENRLVFVVKRAAEKKQIKWAAEKAFAVKVDAVNTMIDRQGRKKASIKLAKEFKAIDIATKFGML